MNIFIEINHYISKIFVDFVVSNNLEGFIGIFADLPIFFLPIFLISSWLFYTFKEPSRNNKSALLYIFYGVLIGISISLTIQQFIHLDRPDTVVHAILHHVPDNSFPSDHAVVSVSFLFGLYFFGFRKLFWYFLPFVVIMNFCRIAGGLHWFFDVFVASFIGFASAFLLYLKKESKFLLGLNSFILKIAKIFKL